TMNNLLTGFVRGLADSDPTLRFRGITLCEVDTERFAEMRQELFRLSSTSLFNEVDLIVDEVEVPVTTTSANLAVTHGPDPVYLIIRKEGQLRDTWNLRVSVLGAGVKARVVTSMRDVDKINFDLLRQKFDKDTFNKVASYGRDFAEIMFTPEVSKALESHLDRHIVVVHD